MTFSSHNRYLTSQFYNDNLDVQQRMLILDTLANAAQKIAGYVVDDDDDDDDGMIDDAPQQPMITELNDNATKVANDNWRSFSK
jgi:hypothetical protein